MGDRRQSSAKIFISSADKQNWVSQETNTRLNIPIEPFILHNNDPAHFVIGLESISLPIALNMINSRNNTIQFRRVGDPTYNSITIPAGNYNTISLVDTLNLLLVEHSIDAEYLFAYDETANQLSLRTYTTAYIEIGSATTAYKILGIAEGTQVRGVIKAGTYVLYIFEGLVNLVSTSGVIIRLLNFQTENRGSNGNGATTIARIPINVQPFRYLSFNIENPFYTSISNRHISNIEIELCDDNYNQLELIGNPDYFLTLRVDYIEPKFYTQEATKLQMLREQARK